VRRLALAVVFVLVVASPALGDDVGRKHQIDTKIATLQDRLAAQKRSERALRNEVDGYTTRIRALEARVGDVSLHLQTLEADLSLHEKRLGALNELFAAQTERWRFLRQEYTRSLAVLDRRVLDIYRSDEPSTLDVLFGSGNLQDAIDRTQYLEEISAQDKRIASEVAYAKRQVTAARAKTRKLRSAVSGETAVIRARTDQTQSVRDELVGAKGDLSTTREKKLTDLSQLTASEQAEVGEIDALQAASERIAAAIRAAQAKDSSGSTQTPSSAGLVWPVSGPITSPFGWRWGRMHQGIDIGVPYGTPIGAAAAGTVIYCGWEEGYGNFVVIDHGGNLATAYGHQSRIAVTCGQQVAQGQTIGYVGCTGHCTGPHLHFEVRIDGNPVDPMGYLG
jgi:murein DD-endopeptidase MepM/ murein hydrolase activator NlpD